MKKIFLSAFILLTAFFVFFFAFASSKNYSSQNSLKISSKKVISENKKNSPEINKNSAKIIFLGDLMFDRYIREVSSKKGNGFIFSKVHNFIAEYDLAVPNLEGPITDNPSLSIGTVPGEKNHLVFTFEPSLARTLFEENIRIVNLGNNHILNFGQSGLESTKKYLLENKVDFFGDTGKDNILLTKNINGLQISFVNYNQFAPGSLERTEENIRKAEDRSDFLVVYTHWGVEYEKTASASQKELGRKFIDLGADLVIGTHPHVIEEKEDHRGKMIYYSLGNFVFDQYFSEETRKGQAIEVRLEKGNVPIFQEFEVFMEKNGQMAINGL